MFELKVLAINVLLPAAAAVVGAVIALRIKGANSSQHSERSVDFVRSVPIGIATIVAIWGAVAFRNEWAVWHEDAWMRFPTGVALVALAAVVTAGLNNVWIVWLLRGGAVFVAALAVFPLGEAWEFLLPKRHIWLSTITLGTVVGWFCIERRQPLASAILGIGWILILIAAAYLTSQSFLKVTEPLMAVAAVLGCLSLLSLRRGSPQLLGVAAGPCLFASSSAIASAQFNSFLGLPDTLSWLAILAPASAAAVTDWTCASANARGRLYQSLWLTLIVCVGLAAVIIAWTELAQPVGGEEW